MAAEPDLFVYLTRVLIVLGVLSASAFVLVRCAKKKNGSDGEGVPVRVLTSLPVSMSALTVTRPLLYDDIQVEDGLRIISCTGTPADCVKCNGVRWRDYPL